MSVVQMIAPLASALAAVLVATDRRIVRRLRNAGATTSARALPLDGGSTIERIRLRRMLSVGAVMRHEEGYYLDEPGFDRWRRTRRRRAVTIVVVLLIVIAAAAAAGWLR
jgi:hypothetical protein